MKRFYEATHPPPPPTLEEITAAAEKGDAAAQVALADVLAKQKDYPSAVAWYRKAADQDNPDAEFFLGDMLLTGRSANASGARRWQRNPNAAVVLAGAVGE